jgi:hypothetical protein
MGAHVAASWLISGVVGVGVFGVVYVVLIAVTALVGIFGRRKSRRAAAMEVLRLLLPCRRCGCGPKSRTPVETG